MADVEIAATLSALVGRLGRLLEQRDLTIAAAESETGGLLASALTDIEDASARFCGAVVAYNNAAKQELLGVSAQTLHGPGAVSAEAAEEMALGARQRFGAGVALAVTGVAGPQSQEGKPVGLTYLGIALPDRVVTREHRWNAGRSANRLASAEAALQLAIEELGGAPA